MIIFPAIDIYGKKAVRLYKGNYNEMTVYSNSPIDVALDFVKCGATHIHTVDLEGAKDGTTPNLTTIADIVRETGLFTEVGGGIRSEKAIEKYLDVGVGRVILGTAAVNDEAFLRSAVEKYGEAVAVGADVRDGFIAIKGWRELSSLSLEAFLTSMQSIGVKNVICTDISKDGAMNGTNLTLYRSLSKKYSMNITASGGVDSIESIRRLREMGLYGAIIGKAYYTGAISLREAIEAAQ